MCVCVRKIERERRRKFNFRIPYIMDGLYFASSVGGWMKHVTSEREVDREKDGERERETEKEKKEDVKKGPNLFLLPKADIFCSYGFNRPSS